MSEVVRENPSGWSRAAEPAGVVLLAVLAALALVQSWKRWLDPVIDTGRDLYVADAMHRGLVLYQGFRYNYPPLAPLLLSAITRLFGSNLAVFAAIGIASGIATAALLYAIVRPLAGPAAAFAATLLFISLNFTGASTWGCNFVFPYAWAATFGIVFFLAAVERLLAFVRAGGNPSFALGVVSCVAAALSKIEFAAAAAVIVAITLWLRRPARRGAVEAIAGIVAITGLLLIRLRGIGLRTIADNLFSGSLLASSQAAAFYSQVTGTAWSGSAIIEILSGVALIAAFAALLRFLEQKRENRAVVAMIVGLIAVMSVVAAENRFFRAWTLLQLILLVVLLVRDRRSPLLLLLAASIAVTSRVYLNISPEWYGFVFDVPLYALIAVVFFDTLPRWGVYPRRLALLWLPVFALLAFRGLAQQNERYAEKRFAIATPRGMLFDYNRDRAAIFGEFLQFVSTTRPHSMVVMPEGITLNYFTRIPNPLSFYLFTPVESGSAEREREIITEMERKKSPELIVLASRNLAEYGSKGFGVDYDVSLRNEIAHRYTLVREWHAPRFSLVVLKRR